MKRDMELVRRVLLDLEDSKSTTHIDGYTEDQVKYHQGMVVDEGLAKGTVMRTQSEMTEIPRAVVLFDLTWAGHDFLEAIREDTQWNKIKGYLAAGGKVLTLETAKLAAKQLFGL